jgi:ATP-dependent RNA helicase DeaD
MIFCSTRRNADTIAESLYSFGIKAKAIHGGLVQNKRLSILREFHDKTFNILVCTDVAARGLDIKCVTHIYNYDLPKDSKDYIHRIGRTARAGENGKVINILSDRDYENFRNIQKNSSLVIIQEELPLMEQIKVNYDDKHNRDRGFRGNQGRNMKRYPERKTSRFISRNFRGRNSRFR